MNMSKFLSNKKEYLSYGAVLLFGLLISAMAASAATTISTNISTGGTLTVTGAVNASSTLATSGNITVPAAYALDTAGGGALNIGTTTATSITIGSSGVATLVRGALNASSTLATSNNITVAAAFGLDTAGGGTLSIGTTTATQVNIGSATAKVSIASTSPWALFSVNPNGLSATSALFSVGSSTATNLVVSNAGNVGVGTSTPVSGPILTVGNNTNTTAASTTIIMGKLQWQGQTSTGATVCVFINGTAATASTTIVAGACNN